MPKTNKQRERARRRRKGELQGGGGMRNIARMQETHRRQSNDAQMKRWAEEAAARRARKRR